MELSIDFTDKKIVLILKQFDCYQAILSDAHDGLYFLEHEDEKVGAVIHFSNISLDIGIIMKEFRKTLNLNMDSIMMIEDILVNKDPFDYMSRSYN